MIRKIIFFSVLVVLSAFHAFAADEPKVAVTVYNNNLALVREARTISLKKGVQEYKYSDVAAQIDPTSVHFKSLTSPESISILEQNFEYDLVGTERLLEKYIGQAIITSTKDGRTFSGTLLSSRSGDVIIQMQDGQVKVVKANSLETIEFPSLPEGLITQPTLVWLLECNKAGKHETEVSYLTKGLSWHAEYVAVTNPEDTELELGGWVSIDNKNEATFDNAKLKLVAGEVHLVRGKQRLLKSGRMAMEAMAVAPQFEEKEFFEYHLYTLQRPATLKDRQIKQLSLFPSTKVQVHKIYTYDGARDEKKVRVNLEFKNDKKSGLGIPLPAGKIRVYKEDVDKSQEFIGEDWIDHTPKDEKVRVYLGNAFDVIGERTVKSTKKISKRKREETIEIKIRNHKKQDITVTVIEHFWGDWQFVEEVPPHKKKSATEVEFKLAVPHDGESTLQFTVHYKY